jgi:predicted RNase H-like nuclease (RuvC/YqgF family)
VADEPDRKPPAEALEECEEKVEHLKEENAVLRHSAEAFGDLAERLNRKHRAVEEKRGEPRKRKRRRLTGKAGK